MQTTPKGLRLHIGIFGRRNAGKSSVLNAITGQRTAIVSDSPGTTTDPVEKAMELLPLGPVVFIDTAGLDDAGALGEQRVARTRQAIERTDVALLVAESTLWQTFEEELLAELEQRGVPVIVVLNKIDIATPANELVARLTARGLPVVPMAATERQGVDDLRRALLATAPDSFFDPPTILGDLVGPGRMVVLVVPIDLEAPKGRLILPQVQTIRDVLDSDAYCAVVKERELRDLLDQLKQPPALVVTDSQAFLKVAADTPDDVPMTSFSILFARFKGDLGAFVEGARTIDKLKPGDKVLIAEACTHHPIGEDIGTVKIPRWLTQYVGGELEFDFTRGRDFPERLADYRLVIHCGSCTFNRRQVLSRVLRCREAGTPITNYGIAIACSLGILDRALGPFPEYRQT